MSFTLLDVPYIGQLDIGGGVPGYKTHSEVNGCWYASSCMVNYFWESGPRQGVPAQYASNPQDPAPMGARYAELMLNEHFGSVKLPDSRRWRSMRLQHVLREHGPCYVRRGFRVNGELTGGHAIVLIGASTTLSRVAVLDPWNDADNRTGFRFFTTAEFNDFFKWDDPNAAKYSLMFRKPPSGLLSRTYISKRLKGSWKNYRA